MEEKDKYTYKHTYSHSFDVLLNGKWVCTMYNSEEENPIEAFMKLSVSEREKAVQKMCDFNSKTNRDIDISRIGHCWPYEDGL